MKRTVLFFLLFCCCLSMQIAKSDPHRNQTIVKVLAAYCNIGVYQTNSGTYDYIQSVTFAKIASQFLDFFAKQPVQTGSQSEKMMVTGHMQKFLQIKEEAYKLIRQTATATQQDDLASKVIAELDLFYQDIYGIKTNNPDKYIGLLNKNMISIFPLDSSYDTERNIFGMKELKDLPETYQYFHSRAKQYNSQFDQDGVIEAIFEIIGTRNKFFVEVGGGNSFDNTYYLRKTKGWNGFLFNSGNYFSNKATDPILKIQQVTPQLACSIFQKYNIPKELDFLSVDIDGKDYHVTKAILQSYKPAVISVEFNSNFPATVSATLKKDLPEVWKKYKSDKIYGVSARAVYELGKAHGYSYVYHLLFTDIFLVRDDLLPAKYRGMKLEDTYDSFPIHALSADNKKYEIMQIFQEKSQQEKPQVVPKEITQAIPQKKIEKEKTVTQNKIDSNSDKFLQKQIPQKDKPAEKDQQSQGQSFYKYFALALAITLVSIVIVYLRKQRPLAIQPKKQPRQTELESVAESEPEVEYAVTEIH